MNKHRDGTMGNQQLELELTELQGYKFADVDKLSLV
jgi:hypothetical protein